LEINPNNKLMARKIFITKANGKKELFSMAKLKRSMAAAGVSPSLINQVVGGIKSNLKSGLSTAEIHRLAFQRLKSANKTYAAKYNLKKAIMRLGPDGFPFEEYFAALLNNQGYKTRTNMIVYGKCITHEVDVIAEKPKENIHAIIEAKFHSRSGMKTGSKDALYTYARFLDIRDYWQNKKKLGAKPAQGKLQGWLVTNTKITNEAIKYCSCVGLKAIGWSYPSRGEGLQGLVQNKGLYPITALISLNQSQKRKLLIRDLVLCQQLVKRKDILKSIGLKTNQIDQVIKEAEDLCRG